jgi:glycosyltransferase involved in cell wall biosynthesis
MSSSPRSICLFGHHEKDYPRNRSLSKALEVLGYRVLEVHSQAPFPWRHFILGAGYLRIYSSVKWVIVTEGGHRLVPFLKILTLLTGRRILFDPFLSRYNTRIEDRKLYSPFGLQALICLWQDWSSTQAADALLFDTHEHQDYFYKKYRLNKPFQIVPVGVDESIFATDETPFVSRKHSADELQVLFYGSFIPLQGIEYIVAAAALLRGEKIRFTLIGKGQTYSIIRNQATELGLKNLDFVEPVPEAGLVPYLSRADICLGIFGATLKAANVVPNKVVQATACSKAVITRDSPAMRRYFTNGMNAMLIAPASATELAEAILYLRDNLNLRIAMGQEALVTFKRQFSVDAIVKALAETLEPA